MPPMMHVWIVDNACGHRFGGVGVGGLNCDVSHDHGPTTTDHDHGPTTTGHDHNTTTTEHDHSASTTTTIDPNTNPTPRRPMTPGARPVHAHPDYAG
jgi:hypothetical protein